MRCCIGGRVLLIALFFAAGALALATGSISGVVTDARTQAPVAKALVTARGPALPGQRSAVADAQGAFEIPRLPAGTYVLTVEREGFQKLESEEVEVESPGTLKVRLQLVALPPPEPLAEVNPPARDGPIDFSDELTQPVFLSGPSLDYTPQALERRVEGTMAIRCVITVAGKVHGCRVLKSLPFMDRATVNALERRKYKPALRAGQPVDVYYTFTITFTLP
ncbi:MAG TPA: TonB family protein [Myxococcales bacterium]|nr:TonB family protein [Myxococcales bacterium]